jgi:hypothetical protein
VVRKLLKRLSRSYFGEKLTMPNPETHTHIGRMLISYDRTKDFLQIWLGSNRDARRFEHEEGLTVSKELHTSRAIGLSIEDYENNFRALPDLSWLRGKGLPQDLLNLVLGRPSFNPAKNGAL